MFSMILDVLHTRRWESGPRAGMLNPEIQELRQEQHEHLNRLALLEGRRQLRERGERLRGEL